MLNNKPVIAISGMIGVGKSTLATIIEKELHLEKISEPVETNPILKKFYENPKKYGFELQMFFINQRYSAMVQALTNGNQILDRHLGEDIVFAKENYDSGNINPEAFNIYLNTNKNFIQSLQYLPKQKPDLTIYLHASMDTVLAHIQKRGRTYEQIKDNRPLLQYYKSLHAQYDPWFNEYDWTPKLKIDMDHTELHDVSSQRQIIQQIQDVLQ